MEKKALQTYLVSNEQVLRTSVVEVKQLDQINSPKMGSINGEPCHTCSQVVECGGHHGHLVLAVPLPKIFFIKHLVKTLNKLCMACFAVLDPGEPNCKSCRSQAVVFTVKQTGVFFKVLKNPDCLDLYFGRIYCGLKGLNLSQLEVLGYSGMNHPASYFWKNLVVPAINTRPQYSETHTRSVVSDLTHHYIQIFKAHAALTNCLKTSNVSDVAVEGNLQANDLFLAFAKTVASAHSEKFKNTGQTSRKFCPNKSSVDSFFKGGKTGLLRANIGARRQDSQATRGVLEGDIYCPLDVISIPVVVAMALTVPMHVTVHNVAEVQKYLMNGPFKFPGANFALTKDGHTLDLEYVNNVRDIRLEEIVCIYRHVVNGDVLVANRQPTLHRGSTISLFARVCASQGPVFSIHPSLFPPLAADCDGDEINISSPQTLEAICEAKQLASPHEHLMKDGTLSIRMIQNAVLGLFVLSRTHTFPIETACQFVVSFDGWPHFAEGVCKVSGFDIFLHLLPADFYCNVPAEKFLIRNGKYLSGLLNKSTINGPRGVIDCLYRQYGSESVYKFIYEGCILAQQVLDYSGCSIGVFDMMLSAQEMQKKTPITSTLQKLAEYAKEQNNKSELVLRQEFSNSFLTVQTQLLGVFRDKKSSEENGCLICIDSGAKGTAGILTQVACFVGQIYSLHNRLPMISESLESSLANRGFCLDSYGRGVSLYTWVRESLPTAESLIDKNKGTGRVGYCFRKMIMALAPLTVAFDKSVCDSNDCFVAERFGDGMDPHKLTKNVFSRIADQSQVCWVEGVPTKFRVGLSAKTINTINKLDTFIKKTTTRFELLTEGKCADQLEVFFPLHLQDLFERFRPQHSTNLSACDVEAVAEVLYTFWTNIRSGSGLFTKNTTLLILLVQYFNFPCVLEKYGLTATALQNIVSIFDWSVRNSSIDPGEAIGILTSQGIGEPFTQMNLTVSAEGNVSATTKGMQNIVDGNFNGCGMEIVLRNQAERVDAEIFAKSLLCTPLKQLLVSFPLIIECEGGSKGSFCFSNQELVSNCVTPTQVCLIVSKKTEIPIEHMRYPSWDPNESCLHIEFQSSKSPDVIGALFVNLFFSSKLEGTPGIDAVTWKYARPKIGVEPRWVILTEGSNLAQVLVLPEVDPCLTVSYNCHEMTEVFGGFVAYKSLQLQIREALNNRVSDAFTDIISRFMFCGGFLHGMKTGCSSGITPALQAATFEGAPKNLSDACSLGLTDSASTVVTAAFANTPIKKGTGYNVEMHFGVPKASSLGIQKKMCEYVVSPKADGVRVLMVFTTDAEGRKVCSLLDRSNCVYRLPVSHIGLPDIFYDTVLDCELVDLTEASSVLLVFDIFASCGHRTSELRYDQRLSVAKKLLSEVSLSFTFHQLKAGSHKRVVPLSPCLINSDDTIEVYQVGCLEFGVIVKPVFKLPKTFSDMKIVTNFSLCRVDGVLFTDCYATAEPFLTNPAQSFKLKTSTGSLDPNSIDFAISEKNAFTQMQNHDSQRSLHDVDLCVLHNKQLVAVASAQLHLGAKVGEVWECAFDNKTQQWVFLKPRHKNPNSLEVAKKNIGLISQPFGVDEFLNCLSATN